MAEKPYLNLDEIDDLIRESDNAFNCRTTFSFSEETETRIARIMQEKHLRKGQAIRLIVDVGLPVLEKYYLPPRA